MLLCLKYPCVGQRDVKQNITHEGKSMPPLAAGSKERPAYLPTSTPFNTPPAPSGPPTCFGTPQEYDMAIGDCNIVSDAATLHGPVLLDKLPEYRSWGYQRFTHPNEAVTHLPWLDPWDDFSPRTFASALDSCRMRDKSPALLMDTGSVGNLCGEHSA